MLGTTLAYDNPRVTTGEAAGSPGAQATHARDGSGSEEEGSQERY